MSTLETVWKWFEPPVVEISVSRCQECDVEHEASESYCPDCGAETTEVTRPIQHLYWGPYH